MHIEGVRLERGRATWDAVSKRAVERRHAVLMMVVVLIWELTYVEHRANFAIRVPSNDVRAIISFNLHYTNSTVRPSRELR